MSKIISDYFHQVDVSMGIVWQNNPIILILIGLIQFIFCSICALGFWASLFNSKSYTNDFIMGISSFIEEKINGLKGTFVMLLFTFFSFIMVGLLYAGCGYLFFKVAKITHDTFVYKSELFIVFK